MGVRRVAVGMVEGHRDNRLWLPFWSAADFFSVCASGSDKPQGGETTRHLCCTLSRGGTNADTR